MKGEELSKDCATVSRCCMVYCSVLVEKKAIPTKSFFIG